MISTPSIDTMFRELTASGSTTPFSSRKDDVVYVELPGVDKESVSVLSLNDNPSTLKLRIQGSDTRFDDKTFVIKNRKGERADEITMKDGLLSISLKTADPAEEETKLF